MPITAEEIIFRYCQGMMFPDPRYYAGKGNSLHDLNSSILEMIYAGVHAEIGADAARSFVNMVKNLKNTNATGFLEEYYRLERKGWKYAQPVMKVRVVDGSPTEEGGAPTAAPRPAVKRMTEILNAFRRSGSVVGHDKAVTEQFLKRHKDEIDATGLSGSYGDALS